MIKKTYGVLALSLLAGLASCSDENPWMGEAGHGAIKLNLTADGHVDQAAPATRAADAVFDVPDAADFSIHLSHSDGSLLQFENLDHFKRTESFKTGAYSMRVFYGRLEDQGFNLPYFEGTETFNVLEGRTTEVSVEAKVANSLVSISYTDEFKNYLSDYSTVIQSGGYDPVTFVGDEDRAAFVAPGEVNVTVSFTNPQGQGVTIQPASFVARPGVHHRLKYNVNADGVGNRQLEVLIDDSLEEEEVVIDLSDELFSAPEPSVVAKGFGSDSPIEFLAGSTSTEPYRFNVISYGGLKEVNLSIASNNGMSFPFGSSIDLLKATPEQQQQLKDFGFDIRGIFKNPDRMAYVDFTGALKNLEPGEYTITVQAKDQLTRSSLPVSAKINAVEATLSAEPLGALAGLNLGSVRVDYYGTNPAADLSFMAYSSAGMWVEAPIKNTSEQSLTRSLETHRYDITITLPDTERDRIPVKVYLYGKEKAQVELEVTEPEFSLQADPYATRAMIKVVPADPDMTSVLTETMRLYVEGGSGNTVLSRDLERGIILLDGFQPSSSYTVRGTLLPALGADAPSVQFTTESPASLPDVAATGNSFKYENVDAGGVYYYKFLIGIPRRDNYMQNWTTISFTEPEGWTTVNRKTCYPGSKYANSNASKVYGGESDHLGMNTWYCVPSTFLSDGGVTLRSVAHDPDGREIPLDDHDIQVKTKYSANAPTYFAYRSAGELFLGSYSFDGLTETRTKGVPFSSRPSSLSFDYVYTPVAGEVGLAEVEVYDASGVVIARGSADIASGSSTGTVTLSGYENFGKKAAKIYVGFRSTKGSDVSAPVPADFVDVSNTTSLNGNSIPENSYKSLCVGSQLVLKNVKLNY